MRLSVLFSRAISVAIILFSGFSEAGVQPSGRSYHVDIKAGSLHDSLLELANELKVSVFFAKETVENLSNRPISGNYSLEELFDALLTDHCVEYEFIRERLVALSPGCLNVATHTLPAPLAELPAATLEQPNIIEEIIVSEQYLTGTRLRQAGHGQNMPLDIIDQTEIRLSGYQAVGELLRYVPAVSGNSTSTLISNGGDGTATVTLRGLPASNTLVLLNGRRINTDALKGTSVDLNTLPLSMIEQIEILKDGVSAIYGSDAVAGVVNIITKKDVQGATIDVYSGQSAEGDLRTQNISFMFGDTGEKWRVVGGFNYYDQSGIASKDRNLSARSDDRPRGGIDKRSSATAPSRIGSSFGAITLAEGALGTAPSDFREATIEDKFEYRDFTSSVVPSQRSSYFANFDWAFNDTWDAYAEILHTRTKAATNFAPVPLFTAFESVPIIVSANQVFNPFGEDVYDLRRRLVEKNMRVQVNETATTRAIFGIQHDRENFHLDLAFQFNNTDATERLNNGVSASAITQALGDACTEPCIPLNLFGPVGSITPQMLSFININAKVHGNSKLYAVTVDTDWSVGSLEISSGLEYRRDELRTTPDETLLSNDLIAGGNRGAIRGDRDIFEAYAESLIPLLANKPGIQSLDLQLAARLSHYSDFGLEINPRIVLSWVPMQGLTVRSSVAKGFRAPSLLQLYAAQIQSFEQLNDPCSVLVNVSVLLGCEVQSDPSLNQYLTHIGGDEDLQPEVSQTISVGIMWRNKFEQTEVALSVDWYHIDQEDVVDSSAQFIISRNARFGSFTDRLSRNSDGNIDTVIATLQNIGKRTVSGIDVSVSIIRNFNTLGLFSFAFNATHIAKFEDQFDPDSPTVNQAGTFRDDASGGLGALPDWKWNAGLSWQKKYWQGHYNVYHVSNLSEVIPRSDTYRTISSWTTHNANLSYNGPAFAHSRITLGVSNLFNEAPPFSAAAFNDSYDGRTYDITGRYYFLKFDRSL